MNQKTFYRGNRVRYIGTLMPLYTGREGEVKAGSEGRGSLIQVLFDGDGAPTGCYPASLFKLRRTPAHIERRDRLLQRYGS